MTDFLNSDHSIAGMRYPRHDVDHRHPSPMAPSAQAEDFSAGPDADRPLPSGAQDLRGAAADRRLESHRAVERRGPNSNKR